MSPFNKPREVKSGFSLNLLAFAGAGKGRCGLGAVE